MLRFGLPYFVGSLALTISSQYVVLVLASAFSNSDVGFYQSAANITVAISLKARRACSG
jgi:O-antigen/teichoic acid export membrane protein